MSPLLKIFMQITLDVRLVQSSILFPWENYQAGVRANTIETRSTSGRCPSNMFEIRNTSGRCPTEGEAIDRSGNKKQPGGTSSRYILHVHYRAKTEKETTMMIDNT